MNKKLFPFFIAFTAFFQLSAQQQFPDPQFWVGQGTDSTLIIIDFKDASVDSSYVWGYLHETADSASGSDALLAIAAADRNLNINIDTATFGFFLQDITYHRHLGLGGQPDYWGTWDGEQYDSLSGNLGIGSHLIDGGIFGCSYTDFNPNTKPGLPWAAYDPEKLTPAKVLNWYGSGSDSLVLLIDFKDGNDTSSYAWGFRSKDSLNGLHLLDTLIKYVPGLSAQHNNGLVTVSYQQQSATIGGTSDWYSWTATNHGNWKPHYTPVPKVGDGQMLAFVYTRFAELQRPTAPVELRGIGLNESAQFSLKVYPNPAQDMLKVEGEMKQLRIFNISGQLVLQSKRHQIDLGGLKAGSYLIRIETATGVATQQLIVR